MRADHRRLVSFPKALADAWTAACTAGDNVILNVPAAGTFQIWPLTLAGPCRSEIKLLVSTLINRIPIVSPLTRTGSSVLD